MTAFEKWLEENKDRLSTYNMDEIVDIAIACGHDIAQISQWKTKTKFGRAA